MSPRVLNRCSRPARLQSLPVRIVLGVPVPVAVTLRSRLSGLALLGAEAAGPGLLIPRCNSIHTFAMRFPLDIHFLGEGDRLLRVCRETPPGRILFHHGARSVLELVALPDAVSRVPGGETPEPGP